MKMLLGGLIHLRSSQPEWLLEVAPQLRSRQVLAPAYLSRALYPPGFIICRFIICVLRGACGTNCSIEGLL